MRAGIERRLRGAGEETRELAVRIRAMLELCVIPPRSDVAALLSWECTEDALMAQLAARDPTGVGVSRWALRLVRRMLSWDPADRPTAERALTHAFFRGEDADGAGYTGADGAGVRISGGVCDALRRRVRARGNPPTRASMCIRMASDSKMMVHASSRRERALFLNSA